MKKYVLIFGVFLLVLGIACATEEMVGCIMMPISGVLYFFGTTSKKVFAFFNMEMGKYLVMAGTVIVITTLIFFIPQKKEALKNGVQSFKWSKWGTWRKRRTLFQLFILGLISFHICLVYFKHLNIPSMCPRSSADIAITGGKFGLSAVYWLTSYILVLIWGRVLCSWLCVYSFVQEQSNTILTAFQKKIHNIVKNNKIIYIITSIFWGSVIYNVVKYALYTDSLTFKFTNGYKVATLWVFWGGILTMLPLTMFLTYYFGNRFFCKYLCPVGGLTSIYSKFSLLKVKIDHNKCKSCKVCGRDCQMGVDIDKYIYDKSPAIADRNCICCGDCIDKCKFDALSYGIVSPLSQLNSQQPCKEGSRA